jgi:hypothetical protein
MASEDVGAEEGRGIYVLTADYARITIFVVRDAIH